MDLKAFLWAHFLSYIETAIGMLLKSMFKLCSGFIFAKCLAENLSTYAKIKS